MADTDSSQYQTGQTNSPSDSAPITTEQLNPPTRGKTTTRFSTFLKRLFISLLGLVVVMVLVLVLATFIKNLPTSSAAKVSNGFINDLRAKKVDEAYGLTTAAYQAKYPKNTFSDGVTSQVFTTVIKASPTIQSRKLLKGNPTKAELKYNFKFDGANYVYTAVLIKDNGWKIDDTTIDKLNNNISAN